MATRIELDYEAYVDEALALLGLEFPSEWKGGVVLNLERTAEIASAFLEFPLADHDELAPVFVP